MSLKVKCNYRNATTEVYESTRVSIGLSYTFGGGGRGWVCWATTRTELSSG